MATPDSPDNIVSTRGGHRAELFLAGLMMGFTIQQAAIKAGISESTAHRYLKSSKFIDQFRLAKKDVRERAILKLSDAVSDAISTLVEIHTDRAMPPANRATCAARIIQMAFEFGPVGEIEDRILQLERRTLSGEFKAYEQVSQFSPHD